MAPGLGKVVLGLSGAGFPLTQLAIRRFGRWGALLVEGVCVGLLARDCALVASGVRRRLKQGPALLLQLELISATVAAVAGLRPLLDPSAARQVAWSEVDAPEIVRRVAVGTLFGLHTMRFRIYLQADRGLGPVSC